MFVLAPAGTLGITAAPSDAETALTAPRTGEAASARKLQSELPPAIVTTSASLPRALFVLALQQPIHPAAAPPADLHRIGCSGPRAPPV